MNTHLSYSERVFIERSIATDKTFATIARVLDRSPSTISREVLKHRVFVNKEPPDSSRECVSFHSCIKHRLCEDQPKYSCLDRCKMCADVDCRTICPTYISSHCERLNRPPYVCTSCPLQKKCQKNHAYYTANRASSMARKNRANSHRGFHTPPEELERIGNLIKPLLNRGQSLHHIYATHQDELGISIRTLYNYIDSGVMTVRNIDLPKKVVYRNRRKKKVLTRLEYKYREGRTYTDYLSYTEIYPDLPVIEMDTVKSAHGCYKSLLTFVFPGSDFFLAFLIQHAGKMDILEVFDYLTNILGLDTFRKLFPIILTDNGVEFKDPIALEHSENGCQRTRIFYCDPMCPTQKPHIEKAHVLLRRIIPKGTSFQSLNGKKVKLMLCHLNSYYKASLSDKSAFDFMLTNEQKKLLTALDLSPVPPDEVNLSPSLLNS